jgi:hypothetical protein
MTCARPVIQRNFWWRERSGETTLREKFKSHRQSRSQPTTGLGVAISRGDETAIELFLAAVDGWEIQTLRLLTQNLDGG